MQPRRRRTDHLPLPSQLPSIALDRARAACEHVTEIGLESAAALHVPDDGTQGLVCAAAGRAEPLLDVARGLARRVAREGRALHLLDTEQRAGLVRYRHAAIPIGRTTSGTVVLVASDQRLTRREGQALAAWAAPAQADGLPIYGGTCTELARQLAGEFHADTVALALFASAGITLNLYVRSGALLHSSRIPTDTVWGEVARHGAAFSLGDLTTHPGTRILGSVGMRTAALVGLENGHDIAIGALGVASAADLDIDISHQLLARAPSLGPELMLRLSATAVPVASADGSVDLGVLAARVGCFRFAMYERDGAELRLVAAHTTDGSRVAAPPGDLEQQLVGWAAQKGIGVVSEDAAAVLVGERTVLYAQDPRKRAIDCLRLALQDVRRNPFGGDDGDQLDLDLDAA